MATATPPRDGTRWVARHEQGGPPAGTRLRQTNQVLIAAWSANTAGPPRARTGPVLVGFPAPRWSGTCGESRRWQVFFDAVHQTDDHVGGLHRRRVDAFVRASTLPASDAVCWSASRVRIWSFPELINFMTPSVFRHCEGRGERGRWAEGRAPRTIAMGQRWSKFSIRVGRALFPLTPGGLRECSGLDEPGARRGRGLAQLGSSPRGQVQGRWRGPRLEAYGSRKSGSARGPEPA